jgi:hypothetical protein
MGESCCTHGRDDKCIQYFVNKPEGKRPFGTLMLRWEDNTRKVVRETGCGLDSSGSE